MGKVANRKRKELFEQMFPKVPKPPRTPKPKDEKPKCCLDRSDLPSWFIPCIDCPKERSDDDH